MKIETLAATDLYKVAQGIGRPGAAIAGANDRDFTEALESALSEMRASVRSGERAATAAMAGAGDIHSVVEALTATEMALETAVVMRDRVVEAYQEILRMPV